MRVEMASGKVGAGDLSPMSLPSVRQNCAAAPQEWQIRSNFKRISEPALCVLRIASPAPGRSVKTVGKVKLVNPCARNGRALGFVSQFSRLGGKMVEGDNRARVQLGIEPPCWGDGRFDHQLLISAWVRPISPPSGLSEISARIKNLLGVCFGAVASPDA